MKLSSWNVVTCIQLTQFSEWCCQGSLSCLSFPSRAWIRVCSAGICWEFWRILHVIYVCSFSSGVLLLEVTFCIQVTASFQACLVDFWPQALEDRLGLWKPMEKECIYLGSWINSQPTTCLAAWPCQWNLWASLWSCWHFVEVISTFLVH